MRWCFAPFQHFPKLWFKSLSNPSSYFAKSQTNKQHWLGRSENDNAKPLQTHVLPIKDFPQMDCHGFFPLVCNRQSLCVARVRPHVSHATSFLLLSLQETAGNVRVQPVVLRVQVFTPLFGRPTLMLQMQRRRWAELRKHSLANANRVSWWWCVSLHVSLFQLDKLLHLTGYELSIQHLSIRSHMCYDICI